MMDSTTYIKIILIAAKEAFKEERLSSSQYLELLNDIEQGIFFSESQKLKIDVDRVIMMYATV